MTITENIFRILNEKNISQKKFSEMTGIAPSTICDWKKGKSPNSDKIAVICNALDVTPYDLIDGIDKRDDIYQNTNKDTEVLFEMMKETNDKIDRMMAYIVALNGRIDKRAK